MTDHTPTPWRANDAGHLARVNGGFVPLRTPFRHDAFQDGPRRSDHTEETLQANARLIVRAVNRDHLFDELVTALESMVFQFEHNGQESDSDKTVLDHASAVLAKAKKG
jgi:hypothetical protein